MGQMVWLSELIRLKKRTPLIAVARFRESVEAQWQRRKGVRKC